MICYKDSIVHNCESSTRYNFKCIEYGDGEFYLSANDEYSCTPKYCPFCGYKPKDKDE